MCLELFDTGLHRPKVLPCGHSLCSECVGKRCLERWCPEDRKEFKGSAEDLPDNFTLLRMLSAESTRSHSTPRKDRIQLEEMLQRGVASGSEVLQQLDRSMLRERSFAEDLRQQHSQIQGTLQRLQSLVRVPLKEAREHALSLAGSVQRMEDGERLLTHVAKCSVTVVGDDGIARRADLHGEEYPLSLLLRLHRDGRLVAQTARETETQEDSGGVSAGVSEPDACGSAQCLDLTNKDGADISRRRHLLQVRQLTGLNCRFVRESYSLLRAVAPRLEELHMDGASAQHMLLLLRSFAALRKLDVTCLVQENFPALPLDLEELLIQNCTTRQLVSTQEMARLRRLQVLWFLGPRDVVFPAPLSQGSAEPSAGPSSEPVGLEWLRVGLDSFFQRTLFSLLHAHAWSLRELRLIVASKSDGDFGIADLGRKLGECGFQELRLLLLERQMGCIPMEHDARSCAQQVLECRSEMRGTSPRIAVQCGLCGSRNGPERLRIRFGGPSSSVASSSALRASR